MYLEVLSKDYNNHASNKGIHTQPDRSDCPAQAGRNTSLGYAPIQPSREAQHDRASGEAEARNVQERQYMDERQRREETPWRTQEVPYDQQWLVPRYPGPTP